LATTFNVEKLFVSKIIQDGNLTEVADVPPYFLNDPDYRNAFEYIRKYYADIGAVPTLREILADFSMISLVEVPESWVVFRRRLGGELIVGGLF